MADSTREQADWTAIRMLLESLFQNLEDVSVRNKAYREAIRKESNERHLMAQVQQELANILALSEPQKYSDLRNRAVRAVEDHSLGELVLLGREAQERVQIWVKP